MPAEHSLPLVVIAAVIAAVLRVSIVTAFYAVGVGVVDYFTQRNYLFLRNIPPTRTFLDYMAPWPWYILTLTVLALAVFNLLYLPFARSGRMQAAAETTA